MIATAMDLTYYGKSAFKLYLYKKRKNVLKFKDWTEKSSSILLRHKVTYFQNTFTKSRNLLLYKLCKIFCKFWVFKYWQSTL